MLESMATRLFRLHGHGVYSSKLLLQYLTTAATSSDQTPFLVNYLVHSLGFSTEKAISTNTKVTRFEPTENPRAVLNFFEQSGLDKTHIGKIVSTVPRLLLCDVDKTLKPKLDILHDVGLSGPDLVIVITGIMSILRSTDISDIQFCISFLRQVLGSDEFVVKALKKKPGLLSVKACERLRTNMLFFQSIGFSVVQIKKFILQTPYTLLTTPERLKEKVHRLHKDFSISPNSGMFFHGVGVLVSLKESTVDAKLGIFRDFGWSKWDTIKLVQLLPYCLRLSEKKLRAALNYYMVELGLKPAYLASRPTLLMFSKKKRVLPRLEFMKILVEKELVDAGYNLYTVLLVSEPRFLEVYVLPHKDKMPDACEVYSRIQQHVKLKK